MSAAPPTAAETASRVEGPAAQHLGARLLRWASFAYLALLVLLWLGTRWVGEATPATTVLLYAPQLLYAAPLPLFLAAALRWRDGRITIALGLSAGLLAGPMMGLCLPLSPPGRHEAAGSLRVMAFNIDNGQRGPAGIRRAVRAVRPDLLLLVEAFPDVGEGLFRDLLSDLPGYSDCHDGECHFMSRFPLAPVGDGFRSSFGACVDVEAPFGKFRAIGLHLGHDPATAVVEQQILRQRGRPGFQVDRADRAGEVRTVETWLARTAGPTLLLGDFNTPPAGRMYRRLTSARRDAFEAGGFGWGYTYPDFLPLLRIDHIVVSDHWSIGRCWVGASRASDHLPLIAEISLEIQAASAPGPQLSAGP